MKFSIQTWLLIKLSTEKKFLDSREIILTKEQNYQEFSREYNQIFLELTILFAFKNFIVLVRLFLNESAINF